MPSIGEEQFWSAVEQMTDKFKREDWSFSSLDNSGEDILENLRYMEQFPKVNKTEHLLLLFGGAKLSRLRFKICSGGIS